jgi:hypothetical protein
MRYSLCMRQLIIPFIAITALGFGCAKTPSYIKAPEPTPLEVPASPESAKASTGGESATITPVLDTVLLVKAFPEPDEKKWSADEPQEMRNPIPLPDGTRSEYVGVARTYQVIQGDKAIAARAILSDTRGIPALTIFLDGYFEHGDDWSYRKKIAVAGQDAWLSYGKGPNGDTDGIGSITMLFRERFLLQIGGEPGLSPDSLTALANAFNWDALR